MKAANILMIDGVRPAICDFGLAKTLEGEFSNTSESMKGAGNLRWMSPELANGGSRTTESDMYSFGMTIVEVITGIVPYPDLQNQLALAHAIIDGRRPRFKPLFRLGKCFNDLWSYASTCWNADPDLRPRAAALEELMKTNALLPEPAGPSGNPVLRILPPVPGTLISRANRSLSSRFTSNARLALRLVHRSSVAESLQPRKKALLIGIRYRGRQWPGTGDSMELEGAHNDIKLWRSTLISCGYLERDICILWDRDGVTPNYTSYPNRENILREMRALTADSQDYQRRFLVFCGNRSKAPNDGSDHALIGADIENPIHDSDVEANLLHPLAKLGSLTMIWDCCYAGNMFSLNWQVDETRMLRPAIRARTDGQSIPGRVLSIGACQDDQKACEVMVPSSGMRYGALTYLLNRKFQDHPNGFSLCDFLHGIKGDPLLGPDQDIVATCTDIVHKPWLYP
ncbi:hypothetical protein FRB95_002201 [Tulasnella sp. JGI-2019a]|nr:hypothetical protein FRB95_002201 [Tulasnella sp. JGI-2019a]